MRKKNARAFRSRGKKMKANSPNPTSKLQPASLRYEAEVLRGLVPFARQELQHMAHLRLLPEGEYNSNVSEDALLFDYAGDSRVLAGLRTVVAVYRVEDFAVPRPKALLGHQHWQRLLAALQHVQKQYDFAGFRLSAAGKDSSILIRLRQDIAHATGLEESEEGELFLRLRPSLQGWQVLMRITPRPLSARAWRVCNMAGGLNATLAASMIKLAKLKPDDKLFNPMCGSATLLVESRANGFTGVAHGCDVAVSAIACSQENIQAAGYSDIRLEQADATQSETLVNHYGYKDYSCIVADVPWGDAIGDTADNLELYSTFLHSMAQVSRSKARLLLLTHDIRKFEQVLASQQLWQKKTVINKIYHGGHHPSLYLFERVS